MDLRAYGGRTKEKETDSQIESEREREKKGAKCMKSQRESVE